MSVTTFCGSSSCMKMAKFVCTRCDIEPYCSETCQAEAIHRHRFVCFPLPPLRLIDDGEDCSEIFNQITSNLIAQKRSEADEQDSGSVISVTLLNILSNIKNASGPSKKMSNEVKVPFAAGPRTIPPADLLKLVRTPKPTPSSVFDGKKENTGKTTESVLSLAGSNVSKRQTQKSEELSRVFWRDMTIKPFPKGRFKAYIVSGDLSTKMISMCLFNQDNLEYIKSISKSINAHTKICTAISYSPQPEEICLAKFEGKYHRACNFGACTGGVKMFFIDHGQVEVLREEDLKPFAKSLMFDIRVHTVNLKNFPNEDEITEEIAVKLNSDFIEVEDIEPVPGEHIYMGRVVGI